MDQPTLSVAPAFQPGKRSIRCRPLLWAAGLAFALAGCSQAEPGDPMTSPPLVPVGRMAGATLPRQAAGYTALGSLPVAGQLQATYTLDSDNTQLAVVTLASDQSFAATPLGADQWFDHSRCGALDELESATQNACVTPLADGVMTVVGTAQTPAQLAELANAIVDDLPT